MTRAALLGLWGVVTLANVTKAVHIDDSTYLLIARHIWTDPLHPMSGTLVLYGVDTPIHATNQPALFYYGLALVAGLSGESLLALHLFVSLFTGLAIFCFHRLARRICPGSALLLTAIFCLGPAFLPSQNLMTDVPVLSLWLAFVLVLLAAGDRERRGSAYALAGLLAGAACLVKYTSLVLLPLLLVPLAVRRDWRHAGCLLVPVGLVAAWSLFNWLDYGAVHILTRPAGEGPGGPLPMRMGDWLLALGAVSPFSLLLVPVIRQHPGVSTGLGLLVALATAGFVVWVRGEGSVSPLLAGVFFANGVAVAAGVVSVALPQVRRRSEAALLLVGSIGGAAAFVVLFAPFIAVRHVLLVVPAILLVLASALPARGARTWLAAACIASAGLGAALALSDRGYADVYRSQAPLLRERYPDARLWYMGDWGWRWYAEEAGMLPYVAGRSELRDGDLVVAPEIPHGSRQLARRDRGRAQVVAEFTVPSGPGTRLRSVRPHPVGGYYGFASPGLPWLITSEPLERFRILRVRDTAPSR